MRENQTCPGFNRSNVELIQHRNCPRALLCSTTLLNSCYDPVERVQSRLDINNTGIPRQIGSGNNSFRSIDRDRKRTILRIVPKQIRVICLKLKRGNRVLFCEIIGNRLKASLVQNRLELRNCIFNSRVCCDGLLKTCCKPNHPRCGRINDRIIGLIINQIDLVPKAVVKYNRLSIGKRDALRWGL